MNVIDALTQVLEDRRVGRPEVVVRRLLICVRASIAS